MAVVFPSIKDDAEPQSENAVRDFLTAMEVTQRSKLTKKTVIELGLDKLPGVFLVSIERPVEQISSKKMEPMKVIPPSKSNGSSPKSATSDLEDSLIEEEIDTKPNTLPLSYDDPLGEGDILWFSGSAAAVGDLRKIPGLKSFVNEEVKKINEKVHDRRLVQAVIARKGALVGKTVREARFRTRFGAAVIAVHREGKRVHEVCI